MLISHTKVQNPRKAGTKVICQDTPHSIARRILDVLYEDLQAKRITATLMIQISRDMRKALYQ